MVKLPSDSERLVILGHTGSGKSQAGIWHLSQRSFDRMPWIILDPKRDDLLARMKMEDMLTEIRIDKPPPKKPGLYIAHYECNTIDDEYLNRFLAQVLSRKNIGIYADEGFTIPNRPYRWTAYGQIQMQGRSKRIPTITLSQRPTLMNRFVWSEASYFQYFGLTDKGDRDTTRRFSGIPTETFPRRFHSWWWDVAQHRATPLQPVPDADTIMQNFRDRLGMRPQRFL